MLKPLLCADVRECVEYYNGAGDSESEPWTTIASILIQEH